VTNGVQAPRAIDFSTLQAVSSGAVGSTALVTRDDIDIFEQSALITEAGVSGVQTCWALDPRESELVDPPGYNPRFLEITELEGTCNLPYTSLTLGPELRVIPDSSGEHRLVVVIVSSTAQIDGLVTSSLLIEGLTDAPQACDDDLTDLTEGGGRRPRIGYSLISELGEGSNLEGTTTDNTVQCNRARSASRSAFFGPLYVDQKEKSLLQQTIDKQQGLCTVINSDTSCLSKRDQRALKKHCSSLSKQIKRGKYSSAQAIAEAIALDARDRNFDGCDATLQEDIIVRALGTAFSIHDGLLHPLPSADPGTAQSWVRYDFPHLEGFIPDPPDEPEP
jgi:hypothetical protein